MTNDSLYSFLKSLTIAIPLLIGIIRFNKIDKTYYPFIVLLFVGCLTEVIHFYKDALFPRLNNAMLSNIYVFVEWPLILWMFYSWHFLRKLQKGIYILFAFVAMLWLVENIVFMKINSYSPYYRILYNSVIVILSINIINYTIIHDNKNIIRNPRFIICLSFIFFFIYKLIYEWAYQYSEIYHYEALRNVLNSSFGYVNMVENIIFIIAVLLIPRHEVHY